jgi:sugar phosphate isomerase/epimerase
MKFVMAAIVAVCGLAALGVSQPKSDPPRDDSAAEKLGWKLATQAWTFRDRTAFETIDTAQKLGLKYIEMYPGQALGKNFPGAKVGPEMNGELRAELKKHLATCRVKLMNFGVVSFTKDEKAARVIFDFAKDMGIETLTCEPALDAWDTVEKLAKEYGINAACHDHPKPSTYWDPQIVLDNIKGRDRRLGACADTGHWPRSGLNAVECLKKLEGHIISLHFKDIAPLEMKGIDQPWGTGDNNAKGMLAELKRQGFKGVISLEYETGEGAELEKNAAKCIQWFDATAAELAQQK